MARAATNRKSERPLTNLRTTIETSSPGVCVSYAIKGSARRHTVPVRWGCAAAGVDLVQNDHGVLPTRPWGCSLGRHHGPSPKARQARSNTASVADLTFLPALRRVRRRNVKSKATLDS